ncbi:MAG: elongation factor G [Planctomycetaceae bacterium]|nr:elongation factor G [Planctomycetales bacterium]MCB9920753.1 elongation factor G [Planctomycetaceae bacterium]
MAKAKVADIRNVAFCGHGSAGKTTLVDKILVKTGAVHSNPKVEDGTSICDFDQEEKDHKYSIEASIVHCEHAGKRFNLIDTPGYPDFVGQAIGALRAVETAAIVIDAHSGIAVNTRRMFQEAEKAGVGRMIVLNRMDTENIDFEGLVNDIRELWGGACVLLNVPVGSGADFRGVVSTLNLPEDTSGALVDPNEIHDSLVESIIESDEAMMERYFEGQSPSLEELSGLIVKAVAAGTFIPIVCCSGQKDIGVSELLDAIAICGLAPSDVTRTATKDGAEVAVSADPNGPLVAQVFKTRIDPFVQKLSFVRVYSGKLKKDDHLHASTARKDIKLGPPLEVIGETTEAVDHAEAGDIVAIAKMDDLHTGSSLGDITMPPIDFPTPMVGLAVSPKSRGDETKMSGALHKVVEEDPTFHVELNAQTKELVMTGMSELHLTVIQQRLARRDKLEIDTHEPKISFRETIQTSAEGSYRHKKQSGGRGQFGEVHIRMRPLPRGTNLEEFCTKANFPSMKEHHYDEKHNFLWVDSVVGGVIPGNFMPAIEKGFKERLEGGVIAGQMVQDLCIEVHYGKHHPVDSSEAAFKTAGRMVFREVFEKAKPCLLEPIVKISITVPEANVGDVYSDMSSRGGRVQGSDAAGGGMQTVNAEIPLREVMTYARTLSSMTGGQGSYHMEFSHYDVMPGNIQQEVMAKFKVEDEDDE